MIARGSNAVVGGRQMSAIGTEEMIDRRWGWSAFQGKADRLTTARATAALDPFRTFAGGRVFAWPRRARRTRSRSRVFAGDLLESPDQVRLASLAATRRVQRGPAGSDRLAVRTLEPGQREEASRAGGSAVIEE